MEQRVKKKGPTFRGETNEVVTLASLKMRSDSVVTRLAEDFSTVASMRVVNRGAAMGVKPSASDSTQAARTDRKTMLPSAEAKSPVKGGKQPRNRAGAERKKVLRVIRTGMGACGSGNDLEGLV